MLLKQKQAIGSGVANKNPLITSATTLSSSFAGKSAELGCFPGWVWDPWGQNPSGCSHHCTGRAEVIKTGQNEDGFAALLFLCSRNQNRLV